MYFYMTLFLIFKLGKCQMEPFIVGGDYTDIKFYPHSAFLTVDCINAFICGGSILTNRIVLTAGHCLYECLNVKDYMILIKYGHELPEHMKTVLHTSFMVHERYDDTSLTNDIGLIFCKNAMELGDLVKRVAIVNKFLRRPKYGYVTGWGVINSNLDTAISLKHVKQLFPPRSTCSLLGSLPPGIFCAGSVDGRQYPEQGDSGGALIIFDYIQIGIVSFRHPKYGLVGYTNTTYYYTWIVETSKKLFCGYYKR